MNVTIEMQREELPFRSMGHHVADPNWSEFDSHGHQHRFVGDNLPSLELVVTGTYWCETCHDEHEESEWRCLLCGEVVNPRFNFTGPISFSLPGMTTYTLHVEGFTPYVITKEQAEYLASLEGEEQSAEALRIVGVMNA